MGQIIAEDPVLPLPINTNTFRRSFLGGDGTLEIHSDGDVWKDLVTSGGVFTPDPGEVDQVADLKVGVKSTKAVRLGAQDGLSLTFGGDFETANRIELIWPSASDPILTRPETSLTDGQLYVRLIMFAKGNASAKGHFAAPAGVKVDFGLSAGGHASYELLRRFEASQTAREIITGLFQSVRLPQQIDGIAELPQPGEVLIVRLGGYLQLSSRATWGYSLSGARALDLKAPRLDLEIEYALKVAASVNVKYRLAGDFELRACRGSEDGWVRYIVRKSRESEFSFAADLGADLKTALTGLPEGENAADTFIAQVLGADAESVLNALAKARELSTLDALQKEVNRLAATAVDKLALAWLDRALDQDNVNAFFDHVGKAIDEYEKLDKRIIQLYDDAIGKLPKLTQTLDTLASFTPERLKDALADAAGAGNRDIAEFVQRTWGDDVFDLLLEKTGFDQFQSFVKEAQDFVSEGAHEHIKTLVKIVKEELNLDELIGRLEKVTDVRTIADERLKGLAERLVGKSFSEFRKVGFDKVLKKIHDTLEKIDVFKKEWYSKLTEAAEQNFHLDLGYAYTRATTDKALVDVEVNLADERGRELAAEAGRGNFVGVFEGYASRAVKVRSAELTRALKTSAHAHINVMGWTFESLVTMVQEPKHTVVAQPGGLLHVFATKTSIEQIKKSGRAFKETVASKFLLQTAASTFQPEGDSSKAIDPKTRKFLVRTLDRMAVEFGLSFDDERTKADELTFYLQFANLLGLIPSVAVGSEMTVSGLVDQLNRQFPGGLGHVSVKYVVRYDDRSVRTAFLLNDPELSNVARAALRQFVSMINLTKSRSPSSAEVALAFTVGRQDLAQRSNEGRLVNASVGFILPSWFTRSAPRELPFPRQLTPRLDVFFNTERRFVAKLAALDAVMDRLERNSHLPESAREPMPEKELNKATADFVSFGDDTDSFAEGAFFVVFDRLIQEGSRGKASRKTAMVLEIQPEGSTDVVRKILTSA
jgi:hypothetical protein